MNHMMQKYNVFLNLTATHAWQFYYGLVSEQENIEFCCKSVNSNIISCEERKCQTTEMTPILYRTPQEGFRIKTFLKRYEMIQ